MALTKEQVEAAHAWADKYIQDKNTELHQKLAEPPIGIMPLKGGLADQLVYNPIIIGEKEFMEDLSKSREAAPDKSNYCCDYDTCIALQKLGCPMAKLGYIGLSLYSAQRWLREEKKLFAKKLYRLYCLKQT